MTGNICRTSVISTRLDTSHSVFKINYYSPLYIYQCSVLLIHTSIVIPRVGNDYYPDSSHIVDYMRLTNTL